MDDTLYKRIQRLRIERNHTQVELGRRIGETLDTINKIETGKLELSLRILEKIQKYFKVKL
jgi:DNA-binding XRE family transcriptional regulator